MPDYQRLLEDGLRASGAGPHTRAIQEVLDLMPVEYPYAGRRVPLRFPHGTYLLDDPDLDGVALRVKSRCLIDLGGSEFIVNNNVTAWKFESPAGWSKLCNGCILPRTRSTEHTGIGVDVAHGTRLSDLIIREMGTGVVANGRGEGHNVNCQQWRDLLLFKCWKAAIHLYGGDCNAGSFSGFEIIGGKVGILDESFLGNAHTGHHISSTSEEAIIISAAANYSTYVGIYIENNCGSSLPAEAPKVRTMARVTTVGGGMVGHATMGDRIGLGMSRIRFQDDAPHKQTLAVTIPHAAANSAITVTHSADPEPWSIERLDRYNQWGIVVSRDNLCRPFNWGTAEHPTHARRPLVEATETRPGGRPIP